MVTEKRQEPKKSSLIIKLKIPRHNISNLELSGNVNTRKRGRENDTPEPPKKKRKFDRNDPQTFAASTNLLDIADFSALSVNVLKALCQRHDVSFNYKFKKPDFVVELEKAKEDAKEDFERAKLFYGRRRREEQVSIVFLARRKQFKNSVSKTALLRVIGDVRQSVADSISPPAPPESRSGSPGTIASAVRSSRSISTSSEREHPSMCNEQTAKMPSRKSTQSPAAGSIENLMVNHYAENPPQHPLSAMSGLFNGLPEDLHFHYYDPLEPMFPGVPFNAREPGYF